MLHWTREADGRFYTAFMCQDLLLNWVVVKAWGSKNKPKTQRQIIACRDKDDAIETLAAITLKRKQRKYKMVELCSLEGGFTSSAANNEESPIELKSLFDE